MTTIYTDGACSGNPGPGWAMWVILLASPMRGGQPTGWGGVKTNIVKQHRVKLDFCTNNEAEYLAVIYALKDLIAHPNLASSPLHFLLDSKLVVEQINGTWKVKDARMKEFNAQISLLRKELSIPAQFTHIPREKNKADALKYE